MAAISRAEDLRPREARLPGSQFASMVAAARNRALSAKREVLVSLSERIPGLDILAALHELHLSSISDERVAAELASACMYWTHPAEDFALIGIGSARTFEASGSGRFEATDGAWQSLLDDAITEDVGGGSESPGTFFIGGFSFEPDGARSEDWRGFSGARFDIPRILLASIDGNCWLTMSVLVGIDGETDIGEEDLVALRDAVRAASTFSTRDVTRQMHAPPVEFIEPCSRDEWRRMVSSALDEIRAGNFEKVVIARALTERASVEIDAFRLLDHLREAHRDSFVFGYWREGKFFVGASPERLVRLRGRNVEASSLAGTSRRGRTSEEDASNAVELMESAKDLAEHAAVRDALFRELAEICEDVDAPDVPSLLSLPHVHHLHTTFTGRLREGHTLFEIVARLHPTPAVGGAPRDAALRFIRRYEKLDRGWYASPIGWIGRQGGEFAVALRSALISGREATLFAGCGIVADSDPDAEYAESSLKMQPMQAAIAAALSDGGESTRDLISKVEGAH